jgi:hypothetical protein
MTGNGTGSASRANSSLSSIYVIAGQYVLPLATNELEPATHQCDPARSTKFILLLIHDIADYSKSGTGLTSIPKRPTNQLGTKAEFPDPTPMAA